MLNEEPMYRAPTVKKAFRILELVAGSDRGMTVSDLAKELPISKSTVHGITRALEEAGALARDGETMRYTLGLTLFELGRAVDSRIDLKDVARPWMERLMEATQETVFLGVRSGNHVSIVESVESTRHLKITAPVGTRLPLLAGATGKAFLACLAEDQASALVDALNLRRYTERSITDPDRYLEDVRKARRVGYALDDEEYIPGVRAVAVPLCGPGRQAAAIWVVGFTPSMGTRKMSRIARATRLAAEEIRQRFDPHPSEEPTR